MTGHFFIAMGPCWARGNDLNDLLSTVERAISTHSVADIWCVPGDDFTYQVECCKPMVRDARLVGHYDFRKEATRG